MAQFMNKADVIPEGVNKNNRNLDDKYFNDNNQKQDIEIVDDAEESDKDEELYNNDNIVPTPEILTNKCDHSDEYNSEGVVERIEHEYNGNIYNKGKQGSFENIEKCQQKTEKRMVLTTLQLMK